MLPLPRPDILKVCLWSMVEKDPLITLGEAKATTMVATSVSVSQYVVCLALKPWAFRHQKVRFRSRTSRTEIAMTAFLERHDRYEAHGRRFVS